MRKMIFLLSCACVALCFFPNFGFAAEGNEGKYEGSAMDSGQKEKETSLYLYYQKYLNPYLNKSRAKVGDKNGVGGGRGSLVSNPTAVLPSNRAKTDDSRIVRDEAASVEKKDASEERPYVTLNRLDSIGLDAVNKTFPQVYRKEYLAELALGVKLSPLVGLSVGKVQKFERAGDSPWGAHDEGWRIRLQKNF
jgi:hypothetical protein